MPARLCSSSLFLSCILLSRCFLLICIIHDIACLFQSQSILNTALCSLHAKADNFLVAVTRLCVSLCPPYLERPSFETVQCRTVLPCELPHCCLLPLSACSVASFFNSYSSHRSPWPSLCSILFSGPVLLPGYPYYPLARLLVIKPTCTPSFAHLARPASAQCRPIRESAKSPSPLSSRPAMSPKRHSKNSSMTKPLRRRTSRQSQVRCIRLHIRGQRYTDGCRVPYPSPQTRCRCILRLRSNPSFDPAVADYAAQALVSTLLAKHFPDIPLIGEEDSADLRTEEQQSVREKIVELANGALSKSTGTDADQQVWDELGRDARSSEQWLESIDRGNAQYSSKGRTSQHDTCNA